MSEKEQPRPEVLLVGPRCPTGGIARFVYLCLQADLGAAIQLFDVARPPKERMAFRADGYNELFNAGLGRAVKGISVTLKHILTFPVALLRSRTQIVHLAATGWFPFWEFSTYGFAAKLMGKRVVLHYHGPFEDFYRRSSGLARFFIRLVLRRLDATVLLSSLDRRAAEEFLPSSKIFVIPNGVCTVPDAVAHTGNKGQGIQVLFLGGVDPIRKGLMDLIKAASILATEGSSVEWIIGGTETSLRVINEHCPAEAMSSIHFVGLLSESEKSARYQSSDVFALPSYEEGMPYGILEAMAYGLPIVSTRIGGIPDVVDEGVNGYLLEPGDYRGIADSVRRLSLDSSERCRIALANRNKVSERFSDETVFRQIGEMYRSLLARAH
jgi:glycosyltransferase involved in cell wall biosynthesis